MKVELFLVGLVGYCVTVGTFAYGETEVRPVDVGPVSGIGPAASIGKRIWPKGTDGCSSSTFAIRIHDGTVLVQGPAGNLGPAMGESVEYGKPAEGRGMRFTLGKPSCRIEFVIRPVDEAK